MKQVLVIVVIVCVVLFVTCKMHEEKIPEQVTQPIEKKPDDVKKEVVEKVEEIEALVLTDEERKKLLLDINNPKNNEKAPDLFKVEFETSKGKIVYEVHRDWSPLGADRFYNFAKNGYFNGCRFFRMAQNPQGKFVAQFGMHGDVQINTVWSQATLKDEPVKKSNIKGYLTYAKTGAPDSRSNQFFHNYGNNSFLDRMGFSPFAKIVSGMDVVEKLNFEYGEKPSQGMIKTQGNVYLKSAFPKLDYIISSKVIK